MVLGNCFFTHTNSKETPHIIAMQERLAQKNGDLGLLWESLVFSDPSIHSNFLLRFCPNYYGN